MALPNVLLTSGKVTWVAPTTGTDGNPLTGGDAITGFTVGIRSLTATGSVAGTYPFTANAASSATSEALSTILASNMKVDSYAAAVQALSANGPAAWSTEFSFQGELPVPNPATGVSVA